MLTEEQKKRVIEAAQGLGGKDICPFCNGTNVDPVSGSDESALVEITIDMKCLEEACGGEWRLHYKLVDVTEEIPPKE
jgi:uncharacterized protein (UPF0212 family)